tara:strand:- start:1414 stop:2454 length:1041 start_codon:yes stop_codon:yes gene_type:complete
MKFQKLYTKQSLTRFLTGVANKCKNIHGANVKASHLLEAVSQEEGFRNFDELASLLVDVDSPFIYTDKCAIFEYKDGRIKLASSSVEYKPRGFWSSPVKIVSQLDPDDLTVKPLTPSITDGSKSSEGVSSIIERGQCLKAAIDDAFEVADLLNFLRQNTAKAPMYLDSSWDVILRINEALPKSEELKPFLERTGTIIQRSGNANTTFKVGQGATSEPRTVYYSQKHSLVIGSQTELNELQAKDGEEFNKEHFRKMSILHPKGKALDAHRLAAQKLNLDLHYTENWPVDSTILINGSLATIKERHKGYEKVEFHDCGSMEGSLKQLHMEKNEVLLVSLPDAPAFCED